MLIKWLPTVAMAEPFEASTLPVLAVTEVNNAVHQDTDCDAVSPLDTSALADIYGDDVAARLDILQKFAVLATSNSSDPLLKQLPRSEISL